MEFNGVDNPYAIKTIHNNTDLNVEDLIVTHNKRKSTRLKVYNKIYSKCCNKLKYINDVLLERECYFSTPGFSWELPLYQPKAALGFVMVKLRGKGFDVKYVDNDKIYINWNKLVESAMNDNYPASKLNADGISVDIADTTVPKPTNIPLKDERFNKFDIEGCGGDCCKNGNGNGGDSSHSTPKVSKQQKLELARQQQQYRIKNMLNRKHY